MAEHPTDQPAEPGGTDTIDAEASDVIAPVDDAGSALSRHILEHNPFFF